MRQWELQLRVTATIALVGSRRVVMKSNQMALLGNNNIRVSRRFDDGKVWKMKFCKKRILESAADGVRWGVALAAVILSIPVMVLISLTIRLFEGLPIFFIQERVGYRGRLFRMYKFRTMKVGAETEQEKYRFLNEADGPVFKIKNDPRFTGIGRYLCQCGIDELPQLFNVLKGEMELIGPRPLPEKEAGQIDEKYKVRQKVKPGIVSPWVFNGYHKLSFDEWMKSDIDYVKKKSLGLDLFLTVRGLLLLVGLLLTNVGSRRGELRVRT